MVLNCWMYLRALQHFLRSFQRDIPQCPGQSLPFDPVMKANGYAVIYSLVDNFLTLEIVPFALSLYHNNKDGLCPPAEMEEARLICFPVVLLHHINHHAPGADVCGGPSWFRKNEIIFPIINVPAHFNQLHDILDIQIECLCDICWCAFNNVSITVPTLLEQVSIYKAL